MELFKLFGSIIIDDDKAIKAINNVDDKTKRAHNTLANFGKAAVVAGTAVAGAFTAMFVTGLRDAQLAEQHIAQMDAVLKSTAGSAGMTRDELLNLAEGFEKTTKFSAEMALEAQNLLLTFTNIGKDTFPRATQAAADMATAMGTDMAGQSIALGKALNDPTKGITALTRVGVTFTEEQKKSIKAMQESGDMAGAQAVILAELEKEFGGSAKAAGETFAGQLVILKNQFGAISEALVVKVMPHLQKFMDWISANMPTIELVMSTFFNTVVNAITWLIDNFNWLMPVMAGVVGGFVAFQIISVIAALFTTLSGIIAGASGAMAIFNAIMAANPIGLIAIAIGLLIAAIALLWTNWDKVSQFFSKTFEDLKKGFENFVNKIIDGINWIIDQANKIPGISIDKVGNVDWTPNDNPKRNGGEGNSNVQAYAKGGVAYGESKIVVGEYANVKSNPEVIAPLSKLESILSNKNGSTIVNNFYVQKLDEAEMNRAINIINRRLGMEV